MYIYIFIIYWGNFTKSIQMYKGLIHKKVTKLNLFSWMFVFDVCFHCFVFVVKYLWLSILSFTLALLIFHLIFWFLSMSVFSFVFSLYWSLQLIVSIFLKSCSCQTDFHKTLNDCQYFGSFLRIKFLRKTINIKCMFYKKATNNIKVNVSVQNCL